MQYAGISIQIRSNEASMTTVSVHHGGAINRQWGLMEINNRPFNLVGINGDQCG